MRVANEPDGPSGGAFAELLRLQADFQARLADETMRYLRRLQHTFEPSVPGTVVRAAEDVEVGASGAPGETVQLTIEVENRQRAHCVVTPVLTPLVDASGTAWFPAAEASPPSSLLAPDQVAALTVDVPLPAELPAGHYRGALILQGFRDQGVPVVVTVNGPTEEEGE